MDILTRIFDWAQELPDWQSHAFRLIWEEKTGQLSDEEIDNLVALIKTSCGIPDSNKRKARPFEFRAEKKPAGSPPMQLCAIRELKNVNALAENQELRFNPNGLTVIYGINGTGKSGYSRVIKRACYARAQGEAILSDAFQGGLKPASAKFVWQGRKDPMTWEEGQKVAKELGQAVSSVAVFDSECARIYIDKKSRSIDYQPYGVGLLRTLVDVCKNRIGKRLADETAVARKNLDEPYTVIVKSPIYYSFIQKIMEGKIKNKQGIKKAKEFPEFTKDDQEQLDGLEENLSGQDSKTRGKELQESLDRISVLIKEFYDLPESLHTISSRLSTEIQDLAAAEKIAILASKQFEADGLLMGTGLEDSWKKMLQAAREFSAKSYEDSKFPTDKTNSRCVLCQQTLKDTAKERLRKFDNFMRDRTEVNLTEKKTNVKKLREELIKTESRLNHLLPSAFYSEILKLSDEAGVAFFTLPTSIKKFVDVLQNKCKALAETPDNHDPNFKDVQNSSSPVRMLEKLSSWIDAEIQKHSKIVVDRDAEINKLKELKAQKAFAENRDAFINLIRLEWCRKEARTRKITDFEKTLTGEEINQALADRLNKEMEMLGDLSAGKEISFDIDHRDGQSIIQLSLPRLVAKCHPMQILSEGEQRAIALASFFAEISMSEDVTTLVFDDPVSSLDDERIINVAKRLQFAAKDEGKQVIVFTHDLYFSNLLSEDENALQIGVSWSETTEDFGNVGKMPFTGMNIGEKIEELDQRAQKLDPKSDKDVLREKIKAAYVDLRDALEHSVEYKLLHHVTTRRSPVVTVGNVTKIFTKPEDKAKIAKVIDCLHKKIATHLHRSERGTKLTVSDLLEDINTLRDVRKQLKSLDHPKKKATDEC